MRNKKRKKGKLSDEKIEHSLPRASRIMFVL